MRKKSLQVRIKLIGLLFVLKMGYLTVIGAHNLFNSKPGVFALLSELKKGDVLSVTDTDGTSIYFIVRDIRTYNALDTDTGIFESVDGGIHLNLITCSGAWDPKTKSHTKRLVIFTDAVQA